MYAMRVLSSVYYITEETTVLEYYPSEIEKFVETLPQDVIDAVVKMHAGTKPAAKEQELRVQTPAGPIVAKVMPDDEYPGIIVMNEKEPGQPAAILEYSPTAAGNTKNCMQLRVYDETNPDDEPVAIYQMSEDIRTKEDKNVRYAVSHACMRGVCAVDAGKRTRKCVGSHEDRIS